MSSITTQQTKLNLELVPKKNRLDIKKCNGRIPHGLTPREPIFQVILDAIALTSCYPAFLITADVPKVYMHYPVMKESKAYKTYLGYAIGVVPPKIARKIKKASPYKKDSDLVPIDEEPVTKEKRVKRSIKKYSTKPATSIVIREPPIKTKSKRKEMSLRDFHKTHPSCYSTVVEKPPRVDKITPTVTSKGTYDKPGVPDVTKDDLTESESESQGNDEDDENDDNDLENKGNDEENKSDDDKTPDSEKDSDSEQDTDASESNFEFDQQEYEEEVKDNDDDDEDNDDDDDDDKSKDIHPNDVEIVSPLDVHVHHENQESIHPLFLLYRSPLSLKHHSDKTRIKIKALPLDQTECLRRERQEKTQNQQQTVQSEELEFEFGDGGTPQGQEGNLVTHVLVMRKHGYGYLEEIVVRRDDNMLYRFKEGDDVVDFTIAIRMFTRSLVIQKGVEDFQLGVKSYQKQINVTKSDTIRPYLKKDTLTLHTKTLKDSFMSTTTRGTG
nr:hypothetical protein [Tanacetum cinerariifolium]